ncbi:MAG: hypothetical protein JO025_02890 [Verrucomicrobia bacterium]|nr:hypothetical protein [Verrucomicrobiota bacterium]
MSRPAWQGHWFIAENGKPSVVNLSVERQTLKADRSAQSRELAPTGPFGFWLEKIFCYSLSSVLDKLSIHTGFVISVFICSQWVSGFVFFDPRETY